MRIIDSHVHLYSQARIDNLTWLNPEHRLYSRHDFEDYSQTDIPDVSAVVFVECDSKPSASDTLVLQEIQEAAHVNSKVKAMIAWAPLHLGPHAVSDFLSRTIAIDTTGLIRGVRVLLQDKPDGFCLRPDFIESIQYLGRMDLLFEIGIDVHRRGIKQLEDALMLIEFCPETTFVIDHIAKPDLSKPMTPDYERLLRLIAGHAKVYMKLSGCLTELESGAVLPHQSLEAHLLVNLELFGTERLLFGSDWPVIKLSPADSTVVSTPLGWFDICRNLLHKFGVAEQEMAQIFFENAIRVYKLQLN